MSFWPHRDGCSALWGVGWCNRSVGGLLHATISRLNSSSLRCGPDGVCAHPPASCEGWRRGGPRALSHSHMSLVLSCLVGMNLTPTRRADETENEFLEPASRGWARLALVLSMRERAVTCHCGRRYIPRPTTLWMLPIHAPHWTLVFVCPSGFYADLTQWTRRGRKARNAEYEEEPETT